MEYKPLEGLTRVVRTLLKAKIGLQIIAVLSGVYLYVSYAALPSDTDIEEVFLTADLVNAVVGMVQVAFGAITVGIVYLCWVYRINKNLNVLHPEGMEYRPGWAVGWYFVPIFNLYKPYQVMKEIWKVSHGEPDGSLPLLNAWWTLWIAFNLLAKAAMKLSMRAESLSESQTATAVYIISASVDIMVDVVVLIMIGRIWTAYQDRFSQRAEESATMDLTMPPIER